MRTTTLGELTVSAQGLGCIAGRRDEVQLATKFGIDRSAGDGARVAGARY